MFGYFPGYLPTCCTTLGRVPSHAFEQINRIPKSVVRFKSQPADTHSASSRDFYRFHVVPKSKSILSTLFPSIAPNWCSIQLFCGGESMVVFTLAPSPVIVLSISYARGSTTSESVLGCGNNDSLSLSASLIVDTFFLWPFLGSLGRGSISYVPRCQLPKSRVSRVISTSWVTVMLRDDITSLIMGQKTGRDAQIVARCTSSADRTMGVHPYQLGSKVGYVPAWVSMRAIRRSTEHTFTLEKLSVPTMIPGRHSYEGRVLSPWSHLHGA